MSQLYAKDGIAVWHLVAAVSSVSSEVTTLCAHPRFTPSERVTDRRPAAGSLCCSCTDREARRAAIAVPPKAPGDAA